MSAWLDSQEAFGFWSLEVYGSLADGMPAPLELDYAKPPSRLSIRRRRKICNPGRCVIMLHKAPPTIHREHTRDIDFRRPGLAKTRAIAARIRFEPGL